MCTSSRSSCSYNPAARAHRFDGLLVHNQSFAHKSQGLWSDPETKSWYSLAKLALQVLQLTDVCVFITGQRLNYTLEINMKSWANLKFSNLNIFCSTHKRTVENDWIAVCFEWKWYFSDGWRVEVDLSVVCRIDYPDTIYNIVSPSPVRNLPHVCLCVCTTTK